MGVTSGRLNRLMVFALLALAVPQVLAAQDTTEYKNHLYDKWQVGLAFTTVLNNSDARVDGSGGELGTTINFKDILGISGNSVQPAITLGWKPGRKTEFDLGYQFLNNSGQRTLDEQIIVGDDTLSADLDATTKIGSSNATFQFKYSILAKPKYTVGLALGLGAIFFDLSIDATASGCVGTACDSGAVNVSEKLTGPTASLGVFGNWRVGDRWYVGADARGLGANVDRYDLSIFEGDVNVRYYLSNRWGVALGWYYTNVTIDVAAKAGDTVAGDLVGNISYNYTSLRLGVLAAF